MPIEVQISVNGKPVESIHIAREEGTRDPESVNTYVTLKKSILPGDKYHSTRFADSPSYKEWDEGVRFEHAYGDGIEVCVRKALEALGVNNG